jgi:hypothetical protein
MKLSWVIVLVGASFFLLGFIILLDQYMRIGVWIQWRDLLNHETFALASFAIGVGVFVGSLVQSSLRDVKQQ